jgi:small ligand-binding sensory domain FIST
MHFASALSTETDPDMAAASLLADIADQMGSRSLDLLLMFISPHFAAHAQMLSERLRQAFHPGVLIGCTAEGVIGSAHEVERSPAISLIAAHLPGAQVDSFALHDLSLRSTQHEIESFAEALASPDEPRLYILLADPFSTPVEALLEAFNTYRAGVPVIGGMASGAVQPGGNVMLLNEQRYRNGAVGVSISGAVAVDVIVSQGCRPVGQPMRVTAVQDNVILGLEGKPPLSCIQEMVDGLDDEERDLLQNGLLIGRVINALEEAPGRGDFLVRGMMGVDSKSGAVAVGDMLDEGELIQFHVRDAATAEEDLEMMLAPQAFYDAPCGAFLFSCNGRGTRLYDHPDGDLSTIQRALGGVHIAGFFCAGEIGPIAGKNFLHGQTASLALFRPG